MNNKKIQFIPSSLYTENFLDPPEPAKKHIPQWYKDIKNDVKKNPVFNNGNLDGNVKMCMPFFDSFTNGYIQKTWCDIYIKKYGDVIGFNYSIADTKIMDVRDRCSIPFYNEEFYSEEFTWRSHWILKTPKNYSVLICHPLNRLDLPFYTLSGIIDSDIYFHTKDGNLPFYIKKDFEGLIPKGTPMYQIIPIKRDNWEKNNIKYNIDVDKRYWYKMSFYWEFYKNKCWQKKSFE